MLWRGGLSMSDFEAFADDINVGMEYLEHHGILGQKWGKQNGPPYPLDSGDHSLSEKSAAQSAGVKVGKSSGKGSIENIKKPRKPKVELTPEQKREAALDAARAGDKKKISKNISNLTTDELREAAERARLKDQLTRVEPGSQKASKAEMEKQEVIRSGDKARVREFADKMSYQELSEAMNRIDLNAKLFYEKPAPTVADKIDKAMENVNRARNWAEKGIAAYNTIAKVYNSTHKGEAMWPEIQAGLSQKAKENKKEMDVLDKITSKATKDISKAAKDNAEARAEAEAKAQAKAEKKAAKEAKKQAKEEAKKQEPTEEKQEQPKTTRDINEGMVKPIREVSNQKMSDYDDFDYSSIFSESYMQSQRDVSMQTALATFDYDDWRDSVRWSDF